MQENKIELFGKVCALGGTITEAMDALEGFVPCGHPAAVVLEALEVCGDDLATDLKIKEQVETVQGFIEHVSDHRGVSAHVGRTSFSTDELEKADKLIVNSADIDAADPDSAQGLYRALAAFE